MVDFFSSIILNVIIIAVSLAVLDWASNLAINNAVKVSTITRIGKTAVGFTLIAFSTSLPELTVAVIAAFSGGAALSIGNVLGSNIANISLIIGAASVLVYLKTRRRAKKDNDNIVKTNIVKSLAKSDLGSIYFGLFISSVIPVVLIFFSTATWLVGLVLFGIFIGYMYQLSKVRIPEEENEPVTIEQKRSLKKYVAFTIVGAIGVVLSAYFLVESAVVIAEAAGLSQQVIGATIIAIGTSLPELTLDIKAILRGHAGLAFGDIIGSCFVNITLILGIGLFVPSVLGTPVELTISVFQNLILFSIVTNLLFWYFLSRGQIGHKEGIIFLFIYALFVITTIGTM
ncbi:MAG: sodium:calcium antiporter [Candidatus Bathyarchaeia archaeon]